MCVCMPKVERAKPGFYAYHDVSLKDDLIQCERLYNGAVGIWEYEKFASAMNGMQLLRDFCAWSWFITDIQYTIHQSCQNAMQVQLKRIICL
jgi:hypothetical protein